MDNSIFQREALGWFDLAERLKSELRVAVFMLDQKGVASDLEGFSSDDLACMDSCVIDILHGVVSALSEFQSHTHFSDHALAHGSRSGSCITP